MSGPVQVGAALACGRRGGTTGGTVHPVPPAGTPRGQTRPGFWFWSLGQRIAASTVETTTEKQAEQRESRSLRRT